MHDLADRDPDGEARAPLSLITSAPLPRVRVSSRIGQRRIPARELFRAASRPAWAVDQIGTMLSPCSPRIRAETCVGGSSSVSAIRLRNRAVSSWVPRPITWPGGRSSCVTARYVRTSTGLETTSTMASCLMPGRSGLAENAEEQLDVAVDQVKPALVRLAAQAGRDEDHVALGNGLVAGRADPLVGDQRCAVEQVEGLAANLVGVQVDQVDLADDAAALQREGRRRADQAAAADDADFHGSFSRLGGLAHQACDGGRYPPYEFRQRPYLADPLSAAMT